MKLFLEITEKDISLEGSKNFAKKYKHRRASRAIVYNSENKIALIDVTSNSLHKLPGGGVEKGESLKQALEREVFEEAGSKIQILEKLGKIIEYRNRWNILQTSYCYIAKALGKPIQPVFTKKEKNSGFQLQWVSLDQAISLSKSDRPEDYEGKFIQLRELEFLKQAKKVSSEDK
jgi:8-oxo-dGTP diphosphatase